MNPFHFLMLSKAVDTTPGMITLYGSEGQGKVGFEPGPSLNTVTQTFPAGSFVQIFATEGWEVSNGYYEFIGWSESLGGSVLSPVRNPMTITVAAGTTKTYYANYEFNRDLG